MNIINIAINEIKRDFRDVKTLVFLLAFPIILMLILGTALTSAFSSTVTVNDVHVLYKNTTNNQDVAASFQSFAKAAAGSGVHFKKAADNVDGKNEVKENKVDGYVEITNKGIKLYESDQNSIEASIIQGMVTAFADKFNVVSAVEKVVPAQVGTALANGSHKNFFKETSLNAAKQPGSMDYYAIAMTTMIALYGAMGASFLIRGERLKRTADRLVAAPITKAEIFIGKILGSILTSALCTIIVVLFSKYVFKCYWGDHLGIVFLVLLSEILLATSFGLGVSYITKTEGASNAIIMVVIQLVAFFGGSYFPIQDSKGFDFTDLSPLKWANDSVVKVIYSNELWPAIHAALLNVGISALFLIVAILFLKRREGL